MRLENEILTPHHVVSFLIIETKIEYSMQIMFIKMTIKIIIFSICFVLRTSLNTAVKFAILAGAVVYICYYPTN